jgi:hypothetical protein
MAMIDLNGLYLFRHVVEQESFASAARLLGVPKSPVSRLEGMSGFSCVVTTPAKTSDGV